MPLRSQGQRLLLGTVKYRQLTSKHVGVQLAPLLIETSAVVQRGINAATGSVDVNKQPSTEAWRPSASGQEALARVNPGGNTLELASTAKYLQSALLEALVPARSQPDAVGAATQAPSLIAIRPQPIHSTDPPAQQKPAEPPRATEAAETARKVGADNLIGAAMLIGAAESSPPSSGNLIVLQKHLGSWGSGAGASPKGTVFGSGAKKPMFGTQTRAASAKPDRPTSSKVEASPPTPASEIRPTQTKAEAGTPDSIRIKHACRRHQNPECTL